MSIRAIATMIAFVLSMSLSASDAFAQSGDPCLRHHNCAECAADTVCRWTIPLGCLSRTTDGVLSQGAYIEDPTQCTTVAGRALRCWQHATCHVCLADPECGWCDVVGSALQHPCSAAVGDGSCPAGHWQRDLASCGPDTRGPPVPCPPPRACSEYTYCGTCALDPACGWCPATRTCLPWAQARACPGAYQGWQGPNACPPLEEPPRPRCTDPCAQHSTCAACASDTHCGWCGSENRCLWGTTNVSTCSNGWALTEMACPDYNSRRCASNAYCNACTTAGGCAWCAATNACQPSLGSTASCPGTLADTLSSCTTEPGADGGGRGRGDAGVRGVVPATAIELHNTTGTTVDYAIGTQSAGRALVWMPLAVDARARATIVSGLYLYLRRSGARSWQARWPFAGPLAPAVRYRFVASQRGGFDLENEP